MALIERGEASHNSRREQEMLEILYQFGAATARQLQARMTAPGSYSSVRALISVMQQKKIVTHRTKGTSYVYEPVTPLELAQETALETLVNVYFAGSSEAALCALRKRAGKPSIQSLGP